MRALGRLHYLRDRLNVLSQRDPTREHYERACLRNARQIPLVSRVQLGCATDLLMVVN